MFCSLYNKKNIYIIKKIYEPIVIVKVSKITTKIFDLFKVCKIATKNFNLFKVDNMTTKNFDMFKVIKMTTKNFDMFKVSKITRVRSIYLRSSHLRSKVLKKVH